MWIIKLALLSTAGENHTTEQTGATQQSFCTNPWMASLFSHSGLSQITTLPNLSFRLSLFHTQQLTFQPTTQRKYKYEFILSKATLSTINLSMFARIVNSCPSLEAEGPTLLPMFWGLLCLSTQGYYYYHKVGLHCLFRSSLLY